jgi:hypothetical protein
MWRRFYVVAVVPGTTEKAMRSMESYSDSWEKPLIKAAWC